jgi:hypothetical protein
VPQIRRADLLSQQIRTVIVATTIDQPQDLDAESSQVQGDPASDAPEAYGDHLPSGKPHSGGFAQADQAWKTLIDFQPGRRAKHG